VHAHKTILICKVMLVRFAQQRAPVSLSRAPCCMQDAQLRMRIHAEFLTNVHPFMAGRARPASRQHASERRASGGHAWPVQQRRGPLGTASLRTQQPHPLLELRLQQDGRLHPPRPFRMSLWWCSAGATKVMRPPRRRALLTSMSQRPCGCWLTARATVATRRRIGCCTARQARMMWACQMARTPSALSKALLSLAALLAMTRVQVGHAAVPGCALGVSECCQAPTHCVLLVLQCKCEPESVSLNCKQAVVRASGSAGGSAADPEHAAPATAAPAAEARRQADKRQAAADEAAGSSTCDSGLPSEGRSSKRHRAAVAGAPSGDEAGVARAAPGVAEAEARCAGEAIDEDDAEGDVRAASRRLGMRTADQRYAAALAHERVDSVEQARSSRLCAALLQCRSLLSHGQLQDQQVLSLLILVTHVGTIGHVVLSLADTASVPHSVPRLLMGQSCLGASSPP